MAVTDPFLFDKPVSSRNLAPLNMVCTRSSYDRKRKRQATVGGGGMMIRCKKDRLQNGGDWANIGVDLLEQIYKMLLPADVLRCRGVCSSWRSVTKTYISSSLNSPRPKPLILWYGDSVYRFLDVSKDAEGNLYLDDLHGSKQSPLEFGICAGFSHGFFLFWSTLMKTNTRFSMFQPRLHPTAALQFPPFPIGIKKHGIKKAVLWEDPILATTRCGIVIIPCVYHPLMFAKSGATEFSRLEGQDHGPYGRSDVICIGNNIYGITVPRDEDHRMEVWDCNSSSEDAPTKVLELQPSFSSGHSPSGRDHSFHLVESTHGGELLLVVIRRPDLNYRPLQGHSFPSSKSLPVCRVYKMDFKAKEWVRVDSLGDHALFVMEFQTMFLSAREFPRFERNTVYFRHHFAQNYHKPRLGIFSLEDCSLKEVNTIW